MSVRISARKRLLDRAAGQPVLLHPGRVGVRFCRRRRQIAIDLSEGGRRRRQIQTDVLEVDYETIFDPSMRARMLYGDHS